MGTVAELAPAADDRNQKIRERATSLLHTLRLFRPWLDDPRVNEIAVNKIGQVRLWINGSWDSVDCAEITLEFLARLGTQIATYAAQSFDEGSPELSAYLPEGERIEMTRAPACPAGVMYLNLRKHTSRAYTLQQLADSGYFKNTRHVTAHSLSDEDRERLKKHLAPEQLHLWELATQRRWQEFLEYAVTSKQNIIVSGATGSGKTSFIRALIDLIPTHERLVTVEDTPEVSLERHDNVQHLFYKKPGSPTGMTAKEALAAVMRKTISRCLLAELRGDEVFYFIQNVLNSGHPGGMATIHANSPNDAFIRLTLLIKASPEGMTMPFEEVRNLLYMLVHVVAQLTFEPGVGRHVPAIYYDPMYALSLMS